MSQTDSNVRERQRINIREPRRYRVFMHNDDFTTMDFVVMVLVTVFYKSDEEAEAIMLQIHNGDKAEVGIYSYDMARTKVAKATGMAREEGYPLRLSIVPEDE